MFRSSVSVKVALGKFLLDSYHSVLHLIFSKANTDYMVLKDRGKQNKRGRGKAWKAIWNVLYKS